jgi:rare lipoprotein A
VRPYAVGLALVFLAACGTTERKGGYYKDDGPQATPPANLDGIADATPRAEALHKWANRPYSALGKNYTPLTSVQPFKQRGMASWYGRRFHGQKTSSGEIYDMYKMTAAHPTLPIPSYVRVTRVAGGKSVVVRINDRGPFHAGRVIDLSYVAAHKLGYIQAGAAEVTLEAIVPGPIIRSFFAQ